VLRNCQRVGGSAAWLLLIAATTTDNGTSNFSVATYLDLLYSWCRRMNAPWLGMCLNFSRNGRVLEHYTLSKRQHRVDLRENSQVAMSLSDNVVAEAHKGMHPSLFSRTRDVDKPDRISEFP
jgi:hypothetical protein